MPHPALASGAVAVITGGAAGIGLAAARRFAGLGLRVCIADLGARPAGKAAEAIAAAGARRCRERAGRGDRCRRCRGR